jgi:D-glycero-D-manno-heptose 1,7-bisphosphate phosphatase
MSAAASGGRAAVFLDRDGVLNEAVVCDGRPVPPTCIDEVVIADGVREACQRLSDAGVVLIVVTNQPDIARRTTTRQAVDRVNDHLAAQLGLDAVYVCPHDDDDACGCRKPAPGMLLDAAEEWGVDLTRSIMVGDRWRDVEAGKRAGVATAWVRSDYREPLPADADHVVDRLLDVVPLMTSSASTGQGSQR